MTAPAADTKSAPTITPSGLTPVGVVTKALLGRSLRVIAKTPSAFIPSIVFPVIITVAFSGAFGGLTRLPGFPTDEMINWMLPMAAVQGAGFAGVAVGLGMVRDIQSGFYDRVLMAPVRTGGLLLGPLMSASIRCLIPLTVVLLAGFATGADLPGGPLGLVVLVVAAVGVAVAAAGWGLGLAVRIRSMQAAPLMQVGVFVSVFFSTAQVPLEVMTGWLRVVARFNPMSPVLALARQGFIGDVTWAATWPGLVALVAAGAVLVVFAARGWRHLLP